MKQTQNVAGADGYSKAEHKRAGGAGQERCRNLFSQTGVIACAEHRANQDTGSKRCPAKKHDQKRHQRIAGSNSGESFRAQKTANDDTVHGIIG